MDTATKGNIGVAMVTADLLRQGYQVLVPISSVSPFDLATLMGGEFLKMQVKYRECKNGVLRIEPRRMIIGRVKTKRRKFTSDEIDVVCTYCPMTGKCYYTRPTVTNLRVEPPASNQRARIHLASDHELLKDLDKPPAPPKVRERKGRHRMSHEEAVARGRMGGVAKANRAL